MDLRFGLVKAFDCEEEGEDEQAHRVPNDIISQQRSGDDPRCVLPARNLYRYEKRAEREDDERKSECDDGVEQRARPFNTESQKCEVEPPIKSMQ